MNRTILQSLFACLVLIYGLSLQAEDLSKAAPTPDNLNKAAISGDLASVNALLKAGANINAIDEDEQTALIHAAENGHTEVMNTLLEAGASIEATDKLDRTPLIYAAKNGHTEAVTKLLNAGANIEATGFHRQTPLFYATENGDTETVKALLEAGASIEADDDFYEMTPLVYAAGNGHTEIVNALLNAGANVDAIDEHAQSALMFAIRSKHHKTAEALLKAGADVNHINTFQRRAIILTKEPEITLHLLRAEAKIHSLDELNHVQTMLDYTIKENKEIDPSASVPTSELTVVSGCEMRNNKHVYLFDHTNKVIYQHKFDRLGLTEQEEKTKCKESYQAALKVLKSGAQRVYVNQPVKDEGFVLVAASTEMAPEATAQSAIQSDQPTPQHAE